MTSGEQRERTKSRTFADVQISIVPEILMPYHRRQLQNYSDLIVLGHLTNDQVLQLVPESVSENLNEERAHLPINTTGKQMIVLVFLDRKTFFDPDLNRAYTSLLHQASHRVNGIFGVIRFNNRDIPILTYSIKVYLRRIQALSI